MDQKVLIDVPWFDLFPTSMAYWKPGDTLFLLHLGVLVPWQHGEKPIFIACIYGCSIPHMILGFDPHLRSYGCITKETVTRGR